VLGYWANKACHPAPVGHPAFSINRHQQTKKRRILTHKD